MKSPWLALVCCVVFLNCDNYACTTSVERSVVVEVYDAATGDPAAAGSRGFIRSGSFVDTLEAYSFRSDGTQIGLAAGWERAGRYEVHIENPSYLSWDTTGVVVGRDECHVETAHVVARLVRR